MTVYRIKNNTDLSMKGSNTVASATSLLSEAVYYVDATAPTNWGSLGYVNLPGVNGNYLSTPDATALDITGDIDIRVRVALDDWTPATVNCLLAKEQTSSTRSYRLAINTDGTVVLVWSADGSATITKASTVATGVADGSVKWIRATLDVDNGASGNDVKFFLSDDGSSWTQLGTTVTTAGVTSIFSSTSEVSIGGRAAGTAEMSFGKVYRAQVLNGIGGTTVLDVNIANDWPSSRLDTFTATTGQTVTVNGVGTVANLGAAGSLLPTTVGSSTAADSNDPKFLDHTGTNYVYTTGVSGNNMTVPDSNALDITGDLDLRVFVALDDWTPAAVTALISKDIPATSGPLTRSYSLNVQTSGVLQLIWSTDGYNSGAITKNSTVATGIPDGAARWVRVTLDVDNGASGNDVKFFTSTDGTTWTQLGSTVTTAGVTSIAAGTANVEIGSISNNTAWHLAGKIFRAQIFNGIDGTKVLDVDTSVITAGSATSFTAVTGQTVTINRSTSGRKTVAVTQPTWLFGTDDYMEVNNRYMSSGTYLYLPGVASNYASAPDSAALDITGDIDLRAKVALDDWTPSSTQVFINKRSGASSEMSYVFSVNSNGTLAFAFTTTGTGSFISGSSTVATGVADGATKWVRVTRASATGTCQFFLSDDGTTWTQLGTDVSTTAGNIYSGTAPMEIGASVLGTQLFARGKFFRAQVLNGINGTVAFDANFETSITSLLQTSFTESSANAATVTINRSGSAYRSAGITTAGYLYPGATNTFAASATDFLNFGTADSFTMLAVFRNFATQSSGRILNKRSSGGILANNAGYEMYNSSSTQVQSFIGDGTNSALPATMTQTIGSLATYAVVINSSGTKTAIGYYNSSTTTSLVNGVTGSLSNPQTLQFGRFGSVSNYADMELYAGAVFRRALLAPEIANIVNYFAARSA